MNIDSVQSLCKCLTNFSDDISNFINQYNENFVENSIAEKNVFSYDDKKAVYTMFSQASILIEACGDYYYCFIKTLTEPVLIISMYSLSRLIIESSSIAVWLLDPKIELNERIRRSLCLRLKIVTEQMKCIQYFNKNDAKKIDAQFQEIKLKTMKLGFVKAPKGIWKSDSLPMPSFVELVKNSMGTDLPYRLFSLFAHSNPSVVGQTCFKKIEIDKNEDGNNDFFNAVKSFDLEKAIFLSKYAVGSFAKPIWMKSRLFGWDDKQLLEIISKYYQLLGIGEENAFWK